MPRSHEHLTAHSFDTIIPANLVMVIS